MPNLANLTVGEELLDSFDIDNINLEVILYQAGYLTIDEQTISRRGKIEYRLKLPNEEVKSSFNDVVLDFPYKDCILEGGQSTEEGYDTYFEYDEKVSGKFGSKKKSFYLCNRL